MKRAEKVRGQDQKMRPNIFRPLRETGKHVRNRRDKAMIDKKYPYQMQIGQCERIWGTWTEGFDSHSTDGKSGTCSSHNHGSQPCSSLLCTGGSKNKHMWLGFICWRCSFVAGLSWLKCRLLLTEQPIGSHLYFPIYHLQQESSDFLQAVVIRK